MTLGVMSAVAMLATGAGFALDSYGSGGKWVAAANELVFVVVGIAFVVRGSRQVKAIAGAPWASSASASG